MLPLRILSLLALAAVAALTARAEVTAEEAFAKAALTLKARGETPDPNDRSISLLSTSDVKTAEEAEPKIIPDELTEMLRAKGFGITGGYGHLTRSSVNLATIQVRYNILQKAATTYATRTNAKTDRSKQAAFGSMNKLSDFASKRVFDGGRKLTADERFTDMSDLPKFMPYISGIYLWGGYSDKEVTFGAEKAKPILAGLGMGFGPLEKGASAVNLDAGFAFYNNSKMPKDDFYIGLSVDLELFKKIVDFF